MTMSKQVAIDRSLDYISSHASVISLLHSSTPLHFNSFHFTILSSPLTCFSSSYISFAFPFPFFFPFLCFFLLFYAATVLPFTLFFSNLLLSILFYSNQFFFSFHFALFHIILSLFLLLR